MPEKQLAWPYNLPIWRRWHRAESPNGCRVAVIDPAHEVSMGNATSGMLCVTGGPHIERCNPSFLWSEDSNYLAVPQYHGFWGRQRLLILVFHDKCVFASKQRDSYFQPESFSGEKLVVRISPFKSDLRCDLQHSHRPTIAFSTTRFPVAGVTLGQTGAVELLFDFNATCRLPAGPSITASALSRTFLCSSTQTSSSACGSGVKEP